MLIGKGRVAVKKGRPMHSITVCVAAPGRLLTSTAETAVWEGVAIFRSGVRSGCHPGKKIEILDANSFLVLVHFQPEN